MSDSTPRTSGIGLFGATFLVFLVLKLTGYITWSWWWITAPLWIGFGIWFIIFVIVMLCIAAGAE
jgi:hypothetical protein